MLNKTPLGVNDFKQDIYVLFAPDYVPQNTGKGIFVRENFSFFWSYPGKMLEPICLMIITPN